MKKLTLYLLLIFFVACNKKEDEPETPSIFMVQAITNGQWKVTNYDKGAVDVTADFNSYTFQFKTNFTVDALNNGTVVKTGNWTADGNAKTITASFANASNPLDLLNGTWNITATTWTSVDANQSVSGEMHVLHLDKL